MQKLSLGLFAGAAILGATALVYAQSVTPIEGNRSVVRPAAPSGTSTTSGAAPNSAVPNQVGSPHIVNRHPIGTPDRHPKGTPLFDVLDD
jgi:hypothetical protein